MNAPVTTKSWNEAVQRQFPWVNIEGLTDRISISKVSPELLEVVPSEEYGTDLSGFYTTDCVELRDGDGRVLGEVEPSKSHADADDMSSNQDGESIGDRWARLANPAAVQFITRATHYSAGVLSSDPDANELEIFKVKEFDIAGWIVARAAAADMAVASALV
jgi:hypothetical protein